VQLPAIFLILHLHGKKQSPNCQRSSPRIHSSVPLSWGGAEETDRKDIASTNNCVTIGGTLGEHCSTQKKYKKFFRGIFYYEFLKAFFENFRRD
jgi:hypothetical protein